MEVISLIILAVYVCIVLFVAQEFEQIADNKGFVGKTYFWWTFLCLPIGMSMVIALPDRKATTIQNVQTATQKTETNYVSTNDTQLPKL